jgi:hypothetical protein
MSVVSNMDLWWPLLFTIAAVALILGPIMMLQPNKRQRELTDLRWAASQLGIRIRLDNSDRKKTAIAVYSLAWPVPVKIDHWCLKRQNFAHDLHFLGFWHWSDDQRPPASWLVPLREILKSLPSDVTGVEGSIDSLGFFWLEKKYQTTLATIHVLLKQSQEKLLTSSVSSAIDVKFEPRN